MRASPIAFAAVLALGSLAAGSSAASPGSPVPPPSTVPDAMVGHLEHPAALDGFFARLGELEDGRGTNDVRVLVFGDSHTASDYGTSVLRKKLQDRFGDGGRGFIPLGEPYKRLFQAGELSSSGVDFRPEEGRYVGGKFSGDGLYGPWGIAMIGAHAGARMLSNYAAPASSIEVAYLEGPRGGSFDLLVDGKKLARIETKRESAASAFRLFDVAEGPHRVEVRANGDGDVRVYGVTLDSRARGVQLDSLGINGAKATHPLEWDEGHTIEQLRHRAPALVIFAYGTNEAGDATTPDDEEKAIVSLARRLQRASASASCLVLGPPDRAAKTEHGWTTMPKLEFIIAAQKRAAAQAGCAFYDQFSAMGGAGSIHAWSKETKSRARGDHVHLTRDGYGTLATDLSRDLLDAYKAYRDRSKPR